MRVPITYIASSGHRYDLVSNGIRHKIANYHRWGYGVRGTKLQYGVRVADFEKDPGEYETELIIVGSDQPGRLIWGDYYIDCYINESDTTPTEYPTQTLNKINIYAPYPFWVQDFKITLAPSQVTEGEYLDYVYDYTYDYTASVIGEATVKSDFPFDSEFEMIIFGPAVNPRITINNYSYVLYATIPQNAYVVIDSRHNTVMMYNANGTKTNMFNFRNKTDSIFKKIPGGNLQITWDATFGVNLTIYRERSEPRVEVSG